MVDLNLPLSWPLFPVLPVVRLGGDPVPNPRDCGIVGAVRATARPVPVVFVCNLCDVGGRTLADLHDDPAVPREVYPDMGALAKVWRPD